MYYFETYQFNYFTHLHWIAFTSIERPFKVIIHPTHIPLACFIKNCIILIQFVKDLYNLLADNLDATKVEKC